MNTKDLILLESVGTYYNSKKGYVYPIQSNLEPDYKMRMKLSECSSEFFERLSIHDIKQLASKDKFYDIGGVSNSTNVWNKLKKCYKEDFSKSKKEAPNNYREVKADMESKEFLGQLKVSTIHSFFTFLGKDYRELSIVDIYEILK